MKIDTTINIRKEILERIDRAAEDCAVSRGKLVSLLLKRVMKENSADKNRFSRVKYQKRDRDAVWKRPHLVLESDLYEKSIDMRKLHKMSVSYIVTVAFNRYFDLVLEELINSEDADKNTRNYICVGKRYGSVFSYTVFWDYPPEDKLMQILE